MTCFFNGSLTSDCKRRMNSANFHVCNCTAVTRSVPHTDDGMGDGRRKDAKFDDRTQYKPEAEIIL